MRDDKASNSARFAEKIRREPYKTFLEKRLHNVSASVYVNIQKNNFPLFVQKNSIVSSILKSDRRTNGNLYIVRQSKKGKLNSIFAHENHLYRISIFRNRQSRQCKTKLHLLACL